ncbi:MAG: PEP-CTERM sorting domain-containing protein [Chthoniobacter sp.]
MLELRGVPEPSTWGLFGLGLGSLLFRVRARRRILS